MVSTGSGENLGTDVEAPGGCGAMRLRPRRCGIPTSRWCCMTSVRIAGNTEESHAPPPPTGAGLAQGGQHFRKKDFNRTVPSEPTTSGRDWKNHLWVKYARIPAASALSIFANPTRSNWTTFASSSFTRGSQAPLISPSGVRSVQESACCTGSHWMIRAFAARASASESPKDP